MSFYNQFLSNFTEEEKQTEVVKLWAAIGMNAEKIIMQEIYALTQKNTDINRFSDDTYESWLGYYMKKLTHKVAPYCTVTLNIVKSTGTVSIDKNTILTGSSGQYLQQSSINLQQGGSVSFVAKQGTIVTETGSYSQMISLLAPKIDLSTIELTLTTTSGTITVPEVEYDTSYVGLDYMGGISLDNTVSDSSGTRGQFHIIEQTGIYNFGSGPQELKKGSWIVYNGSAWTTSMNSQDYSPNQISNAYARPYDGYYAFVSGNYIYIRIFSGPNVPEPEGLSYTMTYLATDGVQGETEENTLDYKETILDNNNLPVEYTISNTKSSKGVNNITSGQLNALLKQSLYTTTSLSSVPEYQAWFLAQPEIGDCLVYTDYERYLETGVFDDITGYVSVLLIDNQGTVVKSSDDLGLTLMNRIEPYKDVSFLQIITPVVISNVLKFHYVSSNDTTSYEALIKSVAEEFYSIDYLKSIGSSMFKNLDIAQLLNTIAAQDSYNSVGLSCVGYHEMNYINYVMGLLNFTVTSYNNEKGWTGNYVFSEYALDENNNIIYDSDGVPTYTGTQYEFNEEQSASNKNIADILYREVNGSITSTIIVGSHNQSTKVVSFDFSNFTHTINKGKFECYWQSDIGGVLSTGALNAQRTLPTMLAANDKMNDTKGVIITQS